MTMPSLTVRPSVMYVRYGVMYGSMEPFRCEVDSFLADFFTCHSIICFTFVIYQHNLFQRQLKIKILHNKNNKSSTDTSTWTPREKKLYAQLQNKTRVAETRKKKLSALRSKSRRLQKKNAELSSVIKTLQSKNLINQETADLLMCDTGDTDFLSPSKSKFSPKIRFYVSANATAVSIE